MGDVRELTVNPPRLFDVIFLRFSIGSTAIPVQLRQATAMNDVVVSSTIVLRDFMMSCLPDRAHGHSVRLGFTQHFTSVLTSTMTEANQKDCHSVPATKEALGEPMSLENKVLTTGAAATQVSS
jgi:hypothetical protein